MFVTKYPYILGACFLLSQCSDMGGYSAGPANMGGPSEEIRHGEIASEKTGDFYYGRRYFVEKTRFWGYLRKPRQTANHSKLVIFKESKKLNPDRMPEDGPPGKRYGFDHNYEYRIYGSFTGENAYDPNSNQFLPVFHLNDYQLVNREPGWLFSPKDHYNPRSFTLTPR